MSARQIYRETSKKTDLLFNRFVMRPMAAVAVSVLASSRVTPNQLTLLNALLFVVGAVLLVALPGYGGGLIAVAVIELSYLFDCADGMLARHRKLASPQGHLFDFFTDELKAVLLAAGLGLRAWRFGAFGYDGTFWPAGDERFLLATIAAVVVVASAISLTTFIRRPEMSGKAIPTEAYLQTEAASEPSGGGASIGRALMTFLRFLAHYPSHIWIFALAGHFELYFWLYGLLNAGYLAKGWLGLVIRFGRG